MNVPGQNQQANGSSVNTNTKCLVQIFIEKWYQLCSNWII